MSSLTVRELPRRLDKRIRIALGPDGGANAAAPVSALILGLLMEAGLLALHYYCWYQISLASTGRSSTAYFAALSSAG